MWAHLRKARARRCSSRSGVVVRVPASFNLNLNAPKKEAGPGVVRPKVREDVRGGREGPNVAANEE
jgi:hypothetical protein